MPKPKLRLAGFVTTDAYLTVHFTIHWTSTSRYLEVKVPMADLGRDVQFGLAYDRTLARLLKAHWELEEPLPLALVGEPPWDQCSEDCTGSHSGDEECSVTP